MSDLTKDEQESVRLALRVLHVQAGRWRAVASALHFAPETLKKVLKRQDRVTATMAFRVARLAGVALEDLLAGRYPPAGTCPHCGRRA